MAYTAIVGNPDLLLMPDVERVLLALLVRDPEPMLAALGMIVPTAPAKPGKSFVEIMTKPCTPEKPTKPIGFSKHLKPIGFASEAPEKHQTLSCVGFASSPPAFQANSTAPSDTSLPVQDDYRRIRDEDDLAAECWDGSDATGTDDNMLADCWDAERGEFRLPATRLSATRLGAR